MNRPAILIAIMLTVSFAFPAVYAAHGGSGGGGGCAGSCIPPTLGMNSDGDVRVHGGLSINSVPFDVDFYSQNIPTQILHTGERGTIVLKIFDNEGPTTLEHVELHFSPYEEFMSGTFVEKSAYTLVWDNKDGDEVIGIYDDDNILRSVAIDAKNDDDYNLISFTFEPMIEFEQTSLMTIIWDNNKNTVKNYFIDAIKVVDPAGSNLSQDKGNGNVVPQWIKTSAGWWAEEKIRDTDFLGGIEFMIKADVLSFETRNIEKNDSASDEIPHWIKNTAKWWSTGMIPEDDFVRGIQFLINNGVISL